MIRVAFLTPSLHTGGAERFILTLARHFQYCKPTAVVQLPMAFQDAEGRVVPILRHHSDPNVIHRIEQVMRVERTKVYGEDLQEVVATGCRDADVVISWGFRDLQSYVRLLSIPVVEVSHASGDWKEQLGITMESWKGATDLVAVSETAKTAFPENVRGKVHVVNNGIDVEHVMPRCGRDHQRKAWGIKEGEKVALFLGRFAGVKRPKLFVTAVSELPDDWKGVMIGHGPDEAAVRKLAGGMCADKILFPGLVSHVGDAFAAADVFAMTSEAEGHPLTLTEAWIAEKPAVCTPFAFLREAEAKLGMRPCLTAMPDPTQVAEKILEAVNDPDCGQRRRRACELFSASAMAARWEALLFEIVKKHDHRQIYGE